LAGQKIGDDDVTCEVARKLLAHTAALDDELAPHVREFRVRKDVSLAPPS
jgi:hypothetical protein